MIIFIIIIVERSGVVVPPEDNVLRVNEGQNVVVKCESQSKLFSLNLFILLTRILQFYSFPVNLSKINEDLVL